MAKLDFFITNKSLKKHRYMEIKCFYLDLNVLTYTVFAQHRYKAKVDFLLLSLISGQGSEYLLIVGNGKASIQDGILSAI